MQSLDLPKNLSINKGDIIRITGGTGAGKTTFINTLLGKDKDGKVNAIIDLKSIHDKVIHLRQDIRDATPFGRVSIYDLFASNDEQTIYQMLSVVGLLDWFENDMKKSFTNHIDGKISGGQKTLLCIAMTLFETSRMKKEMIILDEPEQGLDEEIIRKTFESMIDWLKNVNPHIRILFISHCCDCIVSRLPKHKHWHLERNKETFRLHL